LASTDVTHAGHSGHSGGIKPLNAPRAVQVRTDSNGNPISIQVPPAIGSPRARRVQRTNPPPNPFPSRVGGQNQRNSQTSPPFLQGRELEGGFNRLPLVTKRRASELRQNATPAEHMLWKHLRKTQIEKYKFTRQHPIGPYIVDFCCRSAKLIVELDGGHHATQQDADLKRQRDLENHGYRVVRFWNNEVFENLEGVLFKIVEELERTDPHPNPLPSRERGMEHVLSQPNVGGFNSAFHSANHKNHVVPREAPKALLSDGKWMNVLEIENLWKVNDAWWRGPEEEIARLYYVLRVGNGQKLTIYLDLIANNWFRQAG